MYNGICDTVQEIAYSSIFPNEFSWASKFDDCLYDGSGVWIDGKLSS